MKKAPTSSIRKSANSLELTSASLSAPSNRKPIQINQPEPTATRSMTSGEKFKMNPVLTPS